MSVEIVTPSGTAQVDLDEVDDPAFLLLVTHGSNGGVDAPDLREVRAVALELAAAGSLTAVPWRRC